MLVALIATVGVAAAAVPPSDARDRAFAGSGSVVVDIGGDDTAYAVVLDARGRIMVAGATRTAERHRVHVTAIDADGSVDASFAERGTVRLDLGRGARVTALAAAGDGLVAVGATAEEDDVLVMRLSSDGVPDAGFTARARDALHTGMRQRALAVTVATDGGLVLGGSIGADGGERAFLARLLPDGRLDPSFGDAGRTVLDVAGRDAAVLALASDGQGRLVVAGRSESGAFVARLARSGALDRSFAGDGIALLPLERPVRVATAALDPDGGAVFVARPPAASGSSLAQPVRPDGASLAPRVRPDGASLALRVRPDGARDERFARGGVSELTRDGVSFVPGSVALGTDGSVVIGGTFARADGARAVLLRLAPDGTRDETFAAGGEADASAAALSGGIAAVALQPDGRIVAAGSAGAPAAGDVAVARFVAIGPRCGDGVVAAHEQCDQGAANGGPASCCSATCTPRAAGEVCRAAAGACDEAELCDGKSALCPDDGVARAGAPCRAPAGACDVAEVCSGTSPECPANDVRARGTVCRVAAGACDLDEECDGWSTECPADARRTGECRASRGGCDPPEWCDGSAQDCPADVRLPEGAACDDGDACTAGDTCVADACRGGPRDDFACTGYLCAPLRGRRPQNGGKPRAEALRELGLDVGEVESAGSVCVPAVTSAADAADGSAPPSSDEPGSPAADAGDQRVSYLAYTVRQLNGSARRSRRLVGATLEDRFGVLELAPKKVKRVSLPAAVGVPEAGATHAGAAYQCQELDERARVELGAREIALRVVGEVTSGRFALGRPRRLCYPVRADGAVAADDSADLDPRVCYALQPFATEAPAPIRVPFLVANRFQSLLVERLGVVRELCVPAVLLGAAWDDPGPRRKAARDPEARRPKRDRERDRPPRPHRDRERDRPPRADRDRERPPRADREARPPRAGADAGSP